MFSFRHLSPACFPPICPIPYSKPKEEHLSYRQKHYFRNTLNEKPGVRAEQVHVHVQTCRLPGNVTKSSSALLLSLGLSESSRPLISLTWADFSPLLSGIPMQCFLFCSELWKGTVCLTLSFPFFNSPHPKPIVLFLSQRRKRKASHNNTSVNLWPLCNV